MKLFIVFFAVIAGTFAAPQYPDLIGISSETTTETVSRAILEGLPAFGPGLASEAAAKAAARANSQVLGIKPLLITGGIAQPKSVANTVAFETTAEAAKYGWHKVKGWIG